MFNCAQGTFAKVAFKVGETPYNWNSGAVRLPVFSEEVVLEQEIHHPPILTGDRSEHAERTRFGLREVGGPLPMIVSPGDLQSLLPALTGGTFAGTTIGLGATLPITGWLIDRVTEVFEYQNAMVDRWVLYGKQHRNERGEQSQPNFMVLQVFIFAKDEATGLTFPAGVTFSTGVEYTPFVFEDLTLTLQGETRKVKEIYIDFRNNLRRNWHNSLTATSICPGPRQVRVMTTHPFDVDHEELYNQSLSGAAGSLAFVNGTIGTTFNFAKLQVPLKSPFVAGHTEIGLTLQHAARMTGSTDEMTVTNDITP